MSLALLCLLAGMVSLATPLGQTGLIVSAAAAAITVPATIHQFRSRTLKRWERACILSGLVLSVGMLIANLV